MSSLGAIKVLYPTFGSESGVVNQGAKAGFIIAYESLLIHPLVHPLDQRPFLQNRPKEGVCQLGLVV